MARPIVATAVGGLPEVVLDGETGLLVPGEDPGAVATVIGRLLDDRELATMMGRQGRAHAETALSWDATVAAYQALYTALL
jgi:glycosyltransferase involved in cell wall biosynthesis